MEFLPTSQPDVSRIKMQSSNDSRLFSQQNNQDMQNDITKKNSFKEHLNDQLKQSEANDSKKNNDKNQSDSKLKSKKLNADNQQERSESKNMTGSDSNKEIVENEPKDKISFDKDSNEPVISNDNIDETLVDDAGNSLPLLMGNVLPKIDAPSVDIKQVSGSTMGLLTMGEATKISGDELLQSNEAVLKQQTLVNSVIQNQRMTMAEGKSTSTVIEPLNKNILDKMITTDAAYNKVLDESSTREILAQATKLQQVPISTNVSSSNTLGQNISATPLVEAASTGATTQLPKILSATIGVNVENKNWSQQITQQVNYMAKGGFQQAEIKLNPANLGPMEIKLSVQDDQASVQFITHHAVVRDALDSAIPKLRELFDQQGLNLLDVNVSTQSEQQQGKGETQSQGSLINDSLSELSDNDELNQIKSLDIDVTTGLSIFA